MGKSANIAYDLLLRSTDQKKINDEFKKNIFNNVFFKNIDGLKENAKQVIFNKDIWEYNSKQFCLDYYEDVSFSPIVLLINNIDSEFSFKKDSFKDRIIYAPTVTEILKVLSYVKS